MRCRESTSSAESGRRTRRSVSSMGLLPAGTLLLIGCLRSAVGVLLGEKGTKKGLALLWSGPPCPYFVPERLRDRLPVGMVYLVHPGVREMWWRALPSGFIVASPMPNSPPS